MKALPLVLLGGVATIAAIGGGLAAFAGLTARRVEAALPPQGRFIDIDGNRIHYLDQGSGPVILMVHGLGGQMRNFTYALVDRLKGRFRVVVMERPGAGYSRRAPGASARLGVQADVVAEFIGALGLGKPLLVGHSLGGALSLAVALEHPEAVSGLALISPLTQPQDSPPKAFAGLYIPSPIVRRLVAWTLAAPLAIRNREAVLSAVFGPEPAPDDFATPRRRHAQPAPADLLLDLHRPCGGQRRPAGPSGPLRHAGAARRRHLRRGRPHPGRPGAWRGHDPPNPRPRLRDHRGRGPHDPPDPSRPGRGLHRGHGRARLREVSMSETHFDVIIIGAGLSGIGAAHHLQAQCPGKTYAILEGRDAIGGTWDLFRYPGIRSDSDMYTLGYAFRPWTEAKAIADGPSILNYIRETAAEGGIERHIRFGHKVTGASWSSADALWAVDVMRSDGGRVSFTCGFLFTCTGYYDYSGGHMPDFPGADRFAGRLIHPQAWPKDLDYAGKRVVVIGSGATAVTLVPAMAETAAHGHHAPAHADLCGVAALGGRLGRQDARAAAVQAGLWPDPLAQRAGRHALLQPGPQAPGQDARAHPRLGARPPRPRLRRRLPLHPAL